MTHNILKSIAVLALGAMLLTAFRPMSKGEHELVGNWQYVKSTVAIHWDDPAPFHDSAATNISPPTIWTGIRRLNYIQPFLPLNSRQ